MMAEPYRDSTGKIIPDDHFENDPGMPRDPAKVMTEQQLREFDAETVRLRAEADKILRVKKR